MRIRMPRVISKIEQMNLIENTCRKANKQMNTGDHAEGEEFYLLQSAVQVY